MAVNAMKPVAASGGSIVANFDVVDDGEDAAGRRGARLLSLAIVALGLGVIGPYKDVRGQPLLALQAPQRAYLVALHRVDTGRAVLRPADV
jgi:hypothetical protein